LDLLKKWRVNEKGLLGSAAPEGGVVRETGAESSKPVSLLFN